MSLISGRSPGRGHGNPLQYYCLENSHGQATVHRVAESDTIAACFVFSFAL